MYSSENDKSDFSNYEKSRWSNPAMIHQVGNVDSDFKAKQLNISAEDRQYIQKNVFKDNSFGEKSKYGGLSSNNSPMDLSTSQQAETEQGINLSDYNQCMQ